MLMVLMLLLLPLVLVAVGSVVDQLEAIICK